MDAPTLHSISEVITSTAELVGVLGSIGILVFLVGPIRQRIRSGGDVDMKFFGNALTVRGRTVTEKDFLTGVTEVLPSVLDSVADMEARLKVLETGQAPMLPAPTDGRGVDEERDQPRGEVPSSRPRTWGNGSLGQPHLLWIDYRSAARVMQIQQAVELGWRVSEQGDFDSSVRALEQIFFDGVVYVWRGDNFDFPHVKALADVIKQQAIDRRTRLLVYDPEGYLRTDRSGEVLREGATMVTASAVELAVALNGTYCGGCGRLLAEPGSPFPARLPCPQCGSTMRRFVRKVSDTIGPTVDSASATKS